MAALLQNITSSVTHLLFPHNCLGCATDVLNNNNLLCAKCQHNLPQTNFFAVANNPVEKTFHGRIALQMAAAGFYFTKDSLMQHLLTQLKYKRNKEVGIYLGKLLGYELLKTERFNSVDALVALPLNEKKEFKRGYNQAQLICQGIASIWQKPIITQAVVRNIFTETQTHENRMNRWQNMDGVFAVAQPTAIKGKHILLVDDVITTGATIEACGTQILKLSNTQLSVASVAFTI